MMNHDHTSRCMVCDVWKLKKNARRNEVLWDKYTTILVQNIITVELRPICDIVSMYIAIVSYA